MRYDAMVAPDAAHWLSTDEGERLQAVLRYHKQAGESFEGLRIDAIVHVAVETQLLEGHPVAVRTMSRLLEQGLDRHDALHAIGAALAEHIFGAVHGYAFDASQYEKRPDALTAASWRNSGKDP